MGRTGRFLAVEHWNVEPDIVLLSKALSGGHVPVGALLTRKSVFEKIFNQMDRAVVHGSTFAKNDLAMAAGIATLEVIESEKLVDAAAKRGAELRLALTRMVPGYELMKEVRGKGLMIGLEFGPPKSLRLKASWNVLETANKVRHRLQPQGPRRDLVARQDTGRQRRAQIGLIPYSKDCPYAGRDSGAYCRLCP